MNKCNVSEGIPCFCPINKCRSQYITPQVQNNDSKRRKKKKQANLSKSKRHSIFCPESFRHLDDVNDLAWKKMLRQNIPRLEGEYEYIDNGEPRQRQGMETQEAFLSAQVDTTAASCSLVCRSAVYRFIFD